MQIIAFKPRKSVRPKIIFAEICTMHNEKIAQTDFYMTSLVESYSKISISLLVNVRLNMCNNVPKRRRRRKSRTRKTKSILTDRILSSKLFLTKSVSFFSKELITHSWRIATESRAKVLLKLSLKNRPDGTVLLKGIIVKAVKLTCMSGNLLITSANSSPCSTTRKTNLRFFYFIMFSNF